MARQRMLDRALLEGAADGLRSRAAALSQIEFSAPVSQCFTFDEIHKGLDKTELKNWLNSSLGDATKGPVIYEISACSSEAAQELTERFEHAGKDYKLPRRNDVDQSQVIYVGSSKSIANRLSQHLLFGHRGTYALHLSTWCPPGQFAISVEVQAPSGPITQHILQDAEDALWEHCQPLFGRRGAR